MSLPFRHQTSQRRKSRKLHKCRSRPQKRIQGTAITTDIRNRPQQLQRSFPALHGTSTPCRGPLDGDVSARVVEACEHIDCTCGAQRQNYDLISEMPLRPHSGDPSFQDWRCWRKWEHATCNTGRITSPQFLNHRTLHDLDLQIVIRPQSQECLCHLL